jgi:hypothetical protein
MMKQMDRFIKHLKDKRNIPAHFLISEIYRDNKEMLFNKDEMINLTRDIVEKISLTPENYEKNYLLESLKFFIYYKGRVIV